MGEGGRDKMMVRVDREMYYYDDDDDDVMDEGVKPSDESQ